MAATKKKHRKPRAQRKTDFIRIRIARDQKMKLIEIAERSGLSLSSWLVMIGLREAKMNNE